MKQLSLLDVIFQETGISVQENVSSIISSPMRRDSSPSFHCYYHPDQNDNNTSSISYEYSGYDWGTGKSYNPVSFIHELKGFDNWGETFNYIHQHYGVQVKNTEARYDNQLPELILILTSSVEITRDNSPELEIAILQFLKKDKAPLDNFLSKSKELYI